MQGHTAVLLLKDREETAVMPAVTALVLHHFDMDTGPEGSVVSTG